MALERICEVLGIPGCRTAGFVESLPFSLNDTTSGSETELQAAVSGPRGSVDLPITIERSNYFANLIKRAAAGDTSRSVLTDLERYLDSNPGEVWENSWVRFPAGKLSPFARGVLDRDLLRSKSCSGGHLRADSGKFVFCHRGEEHLRIPISYLIKLALADIIGSQDGLPRSIEETGRRLMRHLLNDNTSPETFSFYVVPVRPESGSGKALARETSKRFLLTQLLVMYANEKFSLREAGQQALLYFSPHPPVRQKQLNESISDSFYRELFMSPCLSGWDNGEEKHAYMCLCHQVLSRSQLNAVAKLREAGIMTRNLVVLPTVSNISLANNGTHVSLGSVKLTRIQQDERSGFDRRHEKYLGDLVIKIVEHFLPLFVGTYSAAPYRLDFTDFHPEQVLGFLPHELDYTHLRMLWRRWKKKASLKVFGQPVTPFGLRSLDRLLSAVFCMRGDFIPDFRLVDYPVSLLSTDRSPAFDGTLDSENRLKQDLAELGVFDTKMALYELYRLREHARAGFSGFEGRHYSLFPGLTDDMGSAVDLQVLVTALAFKYVLQGSVTHAHIPDDPHIESERRQIFFGAAIGVPTFYVREDTGNHFLRDLVHRTSGIRSSRRYPGYLRVYNRQFRRALAEVLVTDAADLVEMLHLAETMKDLTARLEAPEEVSAEGKLVRGILAALGVASPMSVEAQEFNLAAERYYRTSLRARHIEEAFAFLERDFRTGNAGLIAGDSEHAAAIRYALNDRSPLDFLHAVKQGVLSEGIELEELVKLINLLLANTRRDIMHMKRLSERSETDDRDPAPICRSGDGPNLYGTPVLG
ncbi:MAG: hypothetical protein HY914_21450 [Desulfomonile tiedjei]|nr:hypothetical protein [Desulfomonile tiedjei]